MNGVACHSLHISVIHRVPLVTLFINYLVSCNSLRNHFSRQMKFLKNVPSRHLAITMIQVQYGSESSWFASHKMDSSTFTKLGIFKELDEGLMNIRESNRRLSLTQEK